MSRSPFGVCLCAPRVELLLYGKTPHRLSVVKRKRLGFGWEGYNQLSRNFIFEEWSLEKGKTHLVKAIATVEREVSIPSENFQRSTSLQFDSNSASRGLDTSHDDSIDMAEKEWLRRMRISKANKGNVPWNKGRKHSPGRHIVIFHVLWFFSCIATNLLFSLLSLKYMAETLQRIRERTKLAMQDPKVMSCKNIANFYLVNY